MTNYLHIILSVSCIENPVSSLLIMLYCSNFMHDDNEKFYINCWILQFHKMVHLSILLWLDCSFSLAPSTVVSCPPDICYYFYPPFGLMVLHSFPMLLLQATSKLFKIHGLMTTLWLFTHRFSILKITEENVGMHGWLSWTFLNCFILSDLAYAI